MKHWGRIAIPALGAALAMAVLPAATWAQQPDAAALIASEQAAMAKFAWMDGEWRGLAVTQTATGEHRVTQTERIGNLLDGTIKLVEGRGFNPDGSKGFNAFGVIAYDPAAQTFAFTSHAQGQSGSFVMTPHDNGYVWEIPAGPMTIRYTANLANGTWTEIGERIIPGRPPVKFFEMNLHRLGDSAWPGAGAMTAQ
ncbi:MAG: DUF1579 domain-containing protein [Croceibacterium sp.]